MKTRGTFIIFGILTIVLFIPILTHAQGGNMTGNRTEGDVNPPIWKIIQGGRAVHWFNASNPRFAIYNAGTRNDPGDDLVLDKETGLVWERLAGRETPDWIMASIQCFQKDAGGRKGWRLATIEEIASLVDSSVDSPPTLPKGHPFIGVQFDATSAEGPFYWSSTTVAGYAANSAWVVEFGRGDVYGATKFEYRGRAWCVRGGYGHNAY
jgi:hypothetical protein